MTTLTALGLAQALCAATGDSVILVEGYCNGSDSRWSQQFPGLEPDQIETLRNDGLVAIRNDDPAAANAIFGRIRRETVDNDTGMIEGAIHLVRARNGRFSGDRDTDTISFQLDALELPVIAGGVWSTETIAERL